MKPRGPTLALPLAFALAVAQSVWAQPASRPDQRLSSEAVEAQRAVLAAELRSLRERITAETNRETEAQLASELPLLERIDAALLRQLTLLQRTAAVASANAAMEAKLAAGPENDVSDTPPYPLALLDILSLSLEQQEDHGAVLATAADAARAARHNAQDALDRAEEARRKRVEEIDGAADLSAAARARRALRMAELKERLAREHVALAELERAGAKRDLLLHEKTEAVMRAALLFVEQRLALSSVLREESLAGVEQQDFELRQSRESAILDLDRAQERLLAAEKRKDDEAAPSAAILAEIGALRARKERLQLRIGAYGQQEERLGELLQVRERRYRTLANEASRAEIREWAQELRHILSDFERRQQVEEGHAAQVRATRASVKARADEVDPRDPQRRWLREHVAELDARIQVHQDEIGHLEESRSLVERTVGEMRRRTERMTIADRIEVFSRTIAAIWATEIAVLDDRPITVGKVVTALIVLVAGLIASGFLSRLVGRIARRRMALEEGATAAFQSISYYVLVVVIVLIALRYANIPLTVFTILGGAFALGLGFGSQNIVANFISGLILLVERPIKVSDMIEVDGTLGRVEGIGLRATRVRTFDNTHIIVPNTAFLEKNVINWNLADDIIRARVAVGVAYGSPTKEVESLMLAAAESHERVLASPAANVLFSNFGDNALEFQLYFWIRARDVLDRRRIESDTRHEIDRVFREAGIVIAFPQRDVHLDTTQPLQLEWARRDSDETKLP